MKKIAISLAIMFCILCSVASVRATNITNSTNEQQNKIVATSQEKTVATKLGETKVKEKQTLQDYVEAYNDETYGLTAYILNKVQIYSIPFCFIGIAISAIYQYVLGIRKMDTRDKGFAIMISIITLFVIAQVLPLIFAIVVKGFGR